MALKLSQKDFQRFGLDQTTETKKTNQKNPEELPIKMVWEMSFLLPEHKKKMVQYYYKELIKAWFN